MKLLNNKAALLTFLTIIAVAITAFLNLNSEGFARKKNGFTRDFGSYTVVRLKTLAVNKNFRFAGVDSGYVYLHDADPYSIYSIGYGLADLKRRHMDYLVDNEQKLNTAFDMSVKFPDVCIYAFNLASLIKYNLTTNQYSVSRLHRNYTRSVRISASSLVVKEFDSLFKNRVFRKENLNSGSVVEEQSISDKLNDGGMPGDGILLYAAKSGMVIYTHFYRNLVLSMDTNLNILQRFSTIDTFRSYQVLAEVRKGTQNRQIYNFSTPPHFVNYKSRIWDSVLCVCSAVKADNESEREFANNAVIDIYKISNGSYVGSFYIPDEKGSKMKDFIIYKDVLVASYKSSLAVYHLFLPGIPWDTTLHPLIPGSE